MIDRCRLALHSAIRVSFDRLRGRGLDEIGVVDAWTLYDELIAIRDGKDDDWSMRLD